MSPGSPPHTHTPGSRRVHCRPREMDHLPGAGSRRPPRPDVHRGSRRPRVQRDGSALSRAGPDPARGRSPLRAYRHEARGGGEEHADDHPLAGSGASLRLRGLRAGGDAGGRTRLGAAAAAAAARTQRLRLGSRQGPGARPAARSADKSYSCLTAGRGREAGPGRGGSRLRGVMGHSPRRPWVAAAGPFPPPRP